MAAAGRVMNSIASDFLSFLHVRNVTFSGSVYFLVCVFWAFLVFGFCVCLCNGFCWLVGLRTCLVFWFSCLLF